MQIIGEVVEVKQVIVRVEVTEAAEEVVREIYRQHGIPADVCAYYDEKKGAIVVDEEQHTSHSWFETRVLIASPTKVQIDAVKTCQYFLALARDTKAAASRAFLSGDRMAPLI